MTDALTKLPNIEERLGPESAPPDASETALATPEDEAAATDPLGRTNDGPVAVNRDLPESADHGGRD